MQSLTQTASTIQITSDDAYNLDVNIKQLRKATVGGIWKLVEKLEIARNGRIWAVLQYESWNAYLAQPEINLRKETVDNYISLFKRIGKYIKTSSGDEKLIPFDTEKAKLLSPVINEDNAEDLLSKAETLSYSDFLTEIQELRPKPEPLKPAKGKYQVVVIDPPWNYGTDYDPDTRRVASPYPELPTEELKKFEIPADENSIIWLWTTHKFLPDAFELLKVWGFEYKANFVWDKQRMGMGAWLRMQVEFCLLGVKGKPRWKLTNERDILSVARREHSRKPDEFYGIVKSLTPDMNRIDIFSREKRDGFEQYGNENDKF